RDGHVTGVQTCALPISVSASILSSLSIPPEAQSSQTTGIGGQFAVRLFRVSLLIVHPADPQSQWFTIPDLLVMELPAGAPVDIQIGRASCRERVSRPVW